MTIKNYINNIDCRYYMFAFDYELLYQKIIMDKAKTEGLTKEIGDS